MENQNNNVFTEVVTVPISYILKQGVPDDPINPRSTAGWKVTINKQDYGDYIFLKEPYRFNDTTIPEVLNTLRPQAINGIAYGFMRAYATDRQVFREAFIRILHKIKSLFIWE